MTDAAAAAAAAALLAFTEEPRHAKDGNYRRRGRSPSGVVGLDGPIERRWARDGRVFCMMTTTSWSSRKRCAGNGGTTIDPHRDDATTKKTKTKYRDGHAPNGGGEERSGGGRRRGEGEGKASAEAIRHAAIRFGMGRQRRHSVGDESLQRGRQLDNG
jgi:hypothetical protein